MLQINRFFITDKQILLIKNYNCIQNMFNPILWFQTLFYKNNFIKKQYKGYSNTNITNLQD